MHKLSDLEIEVALMASLRYAACTCRYISTTCSSFLIRTTHRNPVLSELFVLYEAHGTDDCAALRERLKQGLARVKPPLKALAAFTCRHWPGQVGELDSTLFGAKHLH